MSVVDLIALVVGGGLGAGARYLVDGLVMRGRRNAFPLGILVVNVSGSFLLGLLTGAGAAVGLAWTAILGIGVLGGYTTLSAVSVETALLAGRRRRDWAWTNLIATVVLSVAAAAAGILLGGLAPGA
jgi:CrcB protein